MHRHRLAYLVVFVMASVAVAAQTPLQRDGEKPEAWVERFDAEQVIEALQADHRRRTIDGM